MTKRKKQHDGVTRKPDRVEKFSTGVMEYRRIQAFECCNYDGTSAGYVPGTPEGDRWLLEKRFIPKDKSEPIRFTNCW